ncbi:hypothetical protein CBFG_05230 [Clostridiales bacterium 1_7_47FAA]|nr:hypothetical protein CBFG_05230 [Clostridiales bacterium 1_7_47FAA]
MHIGLRGMSALAVPVDMPKTVAGFLWRADIFHKESPPCKNKCPLYTNFFIETY